MKIAVAGKGGSGKTTVSGTLARALGRAGHRVLAIDADVNPMLGISLGLGPEATERLVAARRALDAGELDHEPTAEGVVDTFGADAPDGVRLVVVNRIENYGPGCPCCGLNPERLVEDLDGAGRIVLCDLEAGLGTISRLRPGQLDLVLVVAEPTAKSLDVARRAVRLSQDRGPVLVVANRLRDQSELDEVRAAVSGHRVVEVPEDDVITRADRDGLAPIDLGPDGPGVRSLIAIADQLASSPVGN